MCINSGALRFIFQTRMARHTERRWKSSFSSLLKKTACKPKPGFKISVIGCGQTGITIAAFLLVRNLTKNLVLFDMRKDWVKAEALDFLHASCFLGNPQVTPCGDGKNTKDSDIIIVTAGARPSGKDRSRLSVLQKTADIFKSFVPMLSELSPKAVFIVTSNPADIMTWVAQRLGNIEPHRCFSTGCHLDSARFRYLIAQRLKMPTTSVKGYVLGEHGSSSVLAWSSVSVAGVPLMNIVPNIGSDKDKEKWQELVKGVRTGGATVGGVKGYTNWALAMTVVDVVQSMQENSGRVLSVSTDGKGINGIDEHIVLSLPCAITSKGISHILQLPLTADEQSQLLKSADVLLEGQCGVKL